MLTLKLYYLARHPEPRITFMPAPRTPRVKSLIQLLKSPFWVLATLVFLSTSALLAQSFDAGRNLTVAEQYLLAAANERAKVLRSKRASAYYRKNREVIQEQKRRSDQRRKAS